MNGIFAAAGIAEAAWAMEACMLVLAFGIVGLLTLFAFALRSRHLAVFAAVLMLLGTIFFQPWLCFRPFEEAAYADPTWSLPRQCSERWGSSGWPPASPLSAPCCSLSSQRGRDCRRPRPLRRDPRGCLTPSTAFARPGFRLLARSVASPFGKASFVPGKRRIGPDPVVVAAVREEARPGRGKGDRASNVADRGQRLQCRGRPL